MNPHEVTPEDEDLSTPAQADRSATSRMCALNRDIRPVDALIRFVAGPAGEVVPDIRNRLPGRGVWISASRADIEMAVRRKLFARALKGAVTIPAGLGDQTETLLRRDALQMLAIANKAGAIVTGFAKVEGMSGRVSALVEASDGSESEIRRLVGLMHGRGSRRGNPPLVQEFSTDELSLCLGREHVIHAALRVHDASAAFLARIGRLNDFRVGVPAPGAVASGQDEADALDLSRS